MRKYVLILLSVALLLIVMPFSVFAVDIVAEVQFDPESQNVQIVGTIPAAHMGFVSVIITPSSNIEITTENINQHKVIVDSVRVSSDDKFDITIEIPSTFDSGEYVVYIVCDGSKISKNFVFINTQLANSALSEINKSDESKINGILSDNICNFGLDGGEYLKFSTYISKAIYKMRPSGGYNMTSFLNEYITRLAMSYIKSGEKDIGTVLMLYSSYLHVSYYESYDNYSDEIKNELNYLIALSDYGEGYFSDFYNEVLLLARIRKTESIDEFKNFVLSQYEQLGINLAKYNSMDNSYYQNNVFISLHDDITDINCLYSFKTIFDSAVLDQTGKMASYTRGISKSGGGGGNSSSKGGLSVTGDIDNFAKPVETVASTSTALNDIVGHWAQKSIQNLYEKRIISGYDNGEFQPESNITRGEFVTIISKVLELNQNDKRYFDDVNDGDWFSKYVNMVANAGIISGYEGKFYPNNEITREDMTVILYNILKYKGIVLNQGDQEDFEDKNDISDYAASIISELHGNCIVTGMDGKFYPKEPATRAQAATLICNILSRIS